MSRDGGGAGEEPSVLLGTIRETLQDCGADDALLVLGDYQADRELASVVVVGERAAGKSALINALLGRPDLLPTGADGATGPCYLISSADDPGVSVHRRDEATVAVEADDMAEYLERYGRSDSPKMAAWLDVRLADPRLDGLQIVDTPGFSDLDPASTELALSLISNADALMFVASCAAPIGRSQMDFLSRAAQRVENVVFVLTKIDGPAGWQKIVAENQQLLGDQIVRFADLPIRAVSAKWAGDAARVANPDLRSRLLADSGLPALWSDLESIARRRQLLASANQLRAGRSALDIAHRQQAGERAAVEGIVLSRSELDERRAQLEEWRRREQEWRYDLDLMSRKLRRATSNELRHRNQALMAKFDAVTAPPDANLDAAQRELVADINDLQIEMAEKVRAQVVSIATIVGDRIDLGGGRLPARLDGVLDESMEIDITPRSTHTRADRSEEMLKVQTMYMGMNMGHTALTILAGLTTALTMSTPVGWAIAGAGGLFWAANAAFHRKGSRNVAGAMDWARTALNNAAADIDSELGDRIDTAMTAITVALNAAYPKEVARLRADYERMERRISEGEDSRQRQLDKIDNQLESLRWLAGRADKKLELMAARPTT